MMPKAFNLSLTDELYEFINENWGEGTSYSTPSEFVCDLIRQRKARNDAERIRDAIIEGYEDAIAGRTIEYRGDLRTMLRESRP